MHTLISTHAAKARQQCSPCVMTLKVDTASVTELRRMVMRICGESLEFMRIEVCEHGERMKVWLCVGAAMVGQVMAAVMATLPGAEFGRFAHVRPLP